MKKNMLADAITGELMPVRGAGGKSGGKARTPVETPDSLRSIAYARILDMVSEGEIFGFPHVSNPLSDVFFNETPVANDDGSLNFKNISMDWRPGTQDQDYIAGFDTVENEIGVGVELRSDTPWTTTLTNLNLDAVRIRISVPGLSKADTSTGDIGGYTINYHIEVAVDGGSYVTRLNSAFSGKTTTKYERSHRIDLPPATSGWQIRVVRDTGNASTGTIADTTMIESYAELIDAKLRMPMTAAVAIIVDAEQFNSIPSRAYRLRGRIIKVPTNYDPETREYDGVWDGTFKMAYSNNPAWCFYDLAINRRFGLGKRISADLMDKWSLYKIARYCDGMVDDGRGGLEPRFTCNIYLQTREDATRVMQNLTTIFRGIMYASGSTISAVGDMPDDPIYTYTPANVVDGKFSYQGTGSKARHTVALVSWSDQTDFGRAKVEYISDEDGIARYGIQPTEVLAMGCTSRGQARRLGKYLLATSRFETDMVSFSVGIDGTFPIPGRVILVADPLRAGRRNGGRIKSATINTITVDKIPSVDAGDRVTVILPTGVPQERIVASVVGAIITVTVNFDAVPVAQSVWVVESEDVNAQRFRVVSVQETKAGSLEYAVVAVQHVEGKYAFVEQDIAIEEPSINDGISKIVLTPTDVAITWRDIADDNTSVQVVTATWNPVADAVMYELQWRVNDGDWNNIGATPGANREFYSPTSGEFYLQITAINGHGVRSQPAYAGPFVVDPNAKPPLFVGDLEIAIADALLTAENAAAIADGAVVSFWQASPPVIGTGPGEASEGDIWFDTNDGNRIYRVVSGVWADAQDDALATALAAASTAQATADGKVKTYFQSTAPSVGLVLGDLWFDTTAGVGKLYRWSGTSWSQNIADVTADQLGGNGTNLLWDEYSRYQGPSLPSTTVQGSVTRLFQSGDRAVGGTSYGCLQVTTTGTGTGDGVYLGNSNADYNVPLSANGKYIVSAYFNCNVANHQVNMQMLGPSSLFGTTGNKTITAANTWQRLSGLVDLSAFAGGAAELFIGCNVSGVSGRIVKIDGVMIEPQIGTKTTPSPWVAGAAGRNALVAIANAATAQATADGKIDSFYQTSPPTIGTGAGQARDGDIWFDTDDGNKIYTVVSGVWVATPDSRIATAILAAGTAQSTADGKSTLFYAVAASPPTATGVGDLWFQTDTKLMKKWSGSAWIDNGGTLVSSQAQNGYVLPYTYGNELCPNPSFETNVSGTRKTSITNYAAGVDICDGWRVYANSPGGSLAVGIDTFNPKQGTYNLFIGTGGQTVAAGANAETDVQVAQDIDVKGGEYYALSAWISWGASIAVPAGIQCGCGFGVAFYDAAGGYISATYLSQVYNTSSQKDGTVPVPTNAAKMKILAYANMFNSTGAPIVVGSTPMHIRFDTVSVKKIDITGNNPNLIPNSDFSNGLTGWSGTGISVIKDTEAYRLQTGAIANNVTHDITSSTLGIAGFAGTEVTFSCEGVNAGTLTSNSYMRLQIEWLNGVTSLGFSALSNQLDNTTPTDRYTKMVLTERVPTSCDGAKLYMRSRGGGLFIYRRPKLERGGVMTPYTRNAEQVYGQELIYGTSGRRLGDARNMRQAQSAGVGAVASNGVLTATSAGVINVAAFTMSYGGAVTISYSAVSSAVTGLTQNVTYIIYCIDDDYAGGARTWLAATSMATVMNAGVGVVIAGTVKVPTSGSTSPTDPSDPACVDATSYLPDGRLVADLKVGDWVQCWNLDGDKPKLVRRKVRAIELAKAESSALVAENGYIVEQSNSTDMDLRHGGRKKTQKMHGEWLLTNGVNGLEWSRCMDIVGIGYRLVVKVDLGNSMFFAGKTRSKTIATHNIRFK